MNLSIKIWLAFALLSSGLYARGAVTPEETFTDSMGRAIGVYLDQRHPDFMQPRSVRLFLISPVPYSDAENMEARRAGAGADPIWIGSHPHKVFKAVTLAEADATRFSRFLYADLTFEKSHDEFKLLSFCLFQPMHAFEIVFADGKKFEGAICVHCGDLMFRLPRSDMDEYRGVQTKELVAELSKLLPIPEKLEKKYFPKQ